jgi:hypothetical protein
MLDGCPIMPGKVKGELIHRSNIAELPIVAPQDQQRSPSVRWRAGRGKCTCQTRAARPYSLV